MDSDWKPIIYTTECISSYCMYGTILSPINTFSKLGKNSLTVLIPVATKNIYEFSVSGSREERDGFQLAIV